MDAVPGIGFVAGGLCGLTIGAVGFLLWWMGQRQMRQNVFGFILGALLQALDDLQADLLGNHADQARRCRDLCASLQRLIGQ